MPEQNYRHHIVNDNPWQNYTIDVDTLTDRNASTAAVTFRTRNADIPVIRATGSAKRSPKDRFHSVAGEQQAVGRALLALGQHLLDEANRVVPE